MPTASNQISVSDNYAEIQQHKPGVSFLIFFIVLLRLLHFRGWLLGLGGRLLLLRLIHLLILIVADALIFGLGSLLAAGGFLCRSSPGLIGLGRTDLLFLALVGVLV